MDLTKKWDALKVKPISSGLNTIRYTEDSILELFLATDENLSHIFLINLPSLDLVDVKHLKNDNIELILSKDINCLLIRLLDSDFVDLFDDLIVSLAESIKGKTDTKEASKIFIETYIKWNVFFLNTPERKLSKESVIGLWGELCYLLDLVTKKNEGNSVNKVLKAWLGPYGAAHDFEFEKKSVEIKTKLIHSNLVKISSEYQLEKIEDKALELMVISITEAEKGLSLSAIFLMLKSTVINLGGDYSYLLTALEKEGISERSLLKYDEFKFIRKKLEVFDCNLIGFPKLISKELPHSISTVRYSIDTTQIIEHRTCIEQF